MRNGRVRYGSFSKNRLKISSFLSGVNYALDESVLSPSVAKECYNFLFSKGVLTDGYGVEKVDAFSGIKVKRLWLYNRYDLDLDAPDNRLIAHATDGRLYEMTESGWEKLSDVIYTDVRFINYRLYGKDVAFFCSAKEGMFVYDGQSVPYRVENAPSIISLALHYERLFVTTAGEKNCVWFSDDLDPTNWDASLSGGGFIQLIDERGALNRVVSYLGYVYVFRDYGISRISAYGAQTDFAVSNLFVSSGKIFPGSVCLCGDRIIFLAEDGLYAFDGASTHKILPMLDGLFASGESCCCTYASGKYYLAFKRADDGEFVGEESSTSLNNALLVYTVASGEYALSRGMDITSLCKIDEQVFAVTAQGETGIVTANGKNMGATLKKKWSIPKTDLGDVSNKRVREITLFSQSDCQIILKNDKTTKTVFVKGKAEVQKKRVNFSGKRIGLDIVCESENACVSRLSLTFSSR